jgi:hypothetical protein
MFRLYINHELCLEIELEAEAEQAFSDLCRMYPQASIGLEWPT